MFKEKTDPFVGEEQKTIRFRDFLNFLTGLRQTQSSIKLKSSEFGDFEFHISGGTPPEVVSPPPSTWTFDSTPPLVKRDEGYTDKAVVPEEEPIANYGDLDAELEKEYYRKRDENDLEGGSIGGGSG